MLFISLDEGVPRRQRLQRMNHAGRTAAIMRWAGFANGHFITAAEGTGFDASSPPSQNPISTESRRKAEGAHRAGSGH